MRERERESARNHSGSYTSEQSRSHEIALYLLSEHVSAATMLFDFRSLGRKVSRGGLTCFCGLGTIWRIT